MQPSGRGYDHGITTFSPDGRLFQVEYARESVKRGTTTAALKFKDGVVLVCDKRIISRLIIPESIEKMFKIDGHVGIATSGLVADARVELVARVRARADGGRAGAARGGDPVHDQGVLCDAQEDARMVQGDARRPCIRLDAGLRGRARRRLR